jgi:hypothetical protein
MAERKTPTAPGAGSDHTQHRRRPGVSAAEGGAAPQRRKRRPPQHQSHGTPPQTVLADTLPVATPMAIEVPGPGDPVPAPTESILSLRVSASLLGQLEAKAQDEGVGLGVLATELLAEGLVLRAWKSLERQAARRPNYGNTRPHAPSGPRGPRPGGRGPNNRRERGGNRRSDQGGNRRPDSRRGGNIMDDQATFLEYVRTQERKRR